MRAAGVTPVARQGQRDLRVPKPRFERVVQPDPDNTGGCHRGDPEAERAAVLIQHENRRGDGAVPL